MKIGFIADIHEDIASLNEALLTLNNHKIELIVCLGDIAGFTLPFYKYINSRNAETCINTVKKNCAFVVAGNHDLFTARRIPDYSAGFQYNENWYGLDYDIRAKLARNRIWLYEDSELPISLTNGSKEFLRSLEEFIVTEIDGIKFMFSHFCFPDLSGSTIDYPKKSKHLEEHFAFMNDNNCLISFSGHGHPEGCVIASENKLDLKSFGMYRLDNKPHWIVAPCTANTTRGNGVLVFDTATFELNVIPLKTPKIIA